MRPTSPEADDLDLPLDLPPLDGTIGGAEVDEENEGIAHPEDELDEDAAKDHGDDFDDATGEGDAIDEITVEGAEGGWLVDSDDAKLLDVGVFDISLSDETKILDEDEPEVRHGVDEELATDEEAVHSDGGEEGPVAEDEELREEDLPALDADEDGDVDDASLYEGISIGLGPDEELRWDDRAWARVGQTQLPGLDPQGADAPDDPDDSGMLAVPGDDPKLAPRDATWRRLEETGRITAAALVPGDGVVVALDGPDRPMLVRILTDGGARIIAEIESAAADDEIAACQVTGLRWDGPRGCLVATGTFGAQAFRPA